MPWRIKPYAGTFEHYQGLDLLIESSKKVLAEQPDVIYFLVGGKPHQVEKYQKMAADLGVADNFIFTGTVKPGAVPGYVAMADILVTPRIEGNNTPLKIYSYLRSGKPVVATRHLTHTQVLSENVAILADVNPEAFAEGTLKVVKDKKLRESVAKAALELAEEKYSYPVYVEKTRKVYEHLEQHLTA
jgi:glycosyltransferase involved in cell wall biosynthesis